MAGSSLTHHLRQQLRGLSSRRKSAVLIGLLCALLLVALVVPQEGRTTPDEYMSLFQSMPELLTWFQRWGLTRIYQSPAFATVFVMLLVNLGLNLWQRARALPTQVELRAPHLRPGGMKGRKGHRAIPVGANRSALDAAAAALDRRRYEVARSDTSLRALKGRLSPVASVIFHASLILIGAGAVISMSTRRAAVVRLGPTERYAPAELGHAPETWGELANAPFGEIAFTVRDVEVEYTERSEMIRASLFIVDDAGAEHELRPNYPYRKSGINVRFTNFGLAPFVTVLDPARGFSSAAPYKVMVMPEGQADTLPVPGLGEVLGIKLYPDHFLDDDGQHASHSTDLRNPVALIARIEQPDLPEVAVPLGAGPVSLGPYLVSLDKVMYWARIDLAKDRGRWTVYVGLVLAIIGMTWRLGVPRRTIECCFEPLEDGTGILHLAGRSDFTEEPFATQLSQIGDELARELAP